MYWSYNLRTLLRRYYIYIYICVMYVRIGLDCINLLYMYALYIRIELDSLRLLYIYTILIHSASQYDWTSIHIDRKQYALTRTIYTHHKSTHRRSTYQHIHPINAPYQHKQSPKTPKNPNYSTKTTPPPLEKMSFSFSRKLSCDPI